MPGVQEDKIWITILLPFCSYYTQIHRLCKGVCVLSYLWPKKLLTILENIKFNE